MPQTWIAYAADFGYRHGLKIPLISISSIKYLDNAGIQQTLLPTGYLVDTVSGSVLPSFNSLWPNNIRQQLNSVQIEYLSGYASYEAVENPITHEITQQIDYDNTGAIPESIKDAICFIVGQWEMFQSSIEGVMRPFTIPNAAKQLLDPYVDLREWF